MALLVALTLATTAHARSPTPVRQFRQAHPCPATDQVRGPCPGWVVDHITPLCAGGPDHPSNMQWQTRAEAAAKDRQEHAQCRIGRRINP